LNEFQTLVLAKQLVLVLVRIEKNIVANMWHEFQGSRAQIQCINFPRLKQQIKAQMEISDFKIMN
jgi:hypothetical protein